MKQLALFNRAKPGLAKTERCQRTKESPRLAPDGKVTRIILQCTRNAHAAHHGCVFDHAEYERARTREAVAWVREQAKLASK